MVICESCGHSTTRSSIQKSYLKKVGLYYLFDRIFFLVNGCRNGPQPDRSPVKFMNYCFQHLCVDLVQAKAVDLHPVKGVTGNIFCYSAVMIDLGKISYPTQQTVDDPRCSTASACD